MLLWRESILIGLLSRVVLFQSMTVARMLTAGDLSPQKLLQLHQQCPGHVKLTCLWRWGRCCTPVGVTSVSRVRPSSDFLICRARRESEVLRLEMVTVRRLQVLWAAQISYGGLYLSISFLHCFSSFLSFFSFFLFYFLFLLACHFYLFRLFLSFFFLRFQKLFVCLLLFFFPFFLAYFLFYV